MGFELLPAASYASLPQFVCGKHVTERNYFSPASDDMRRRQPVGGTCWQNVRKTFVPEFISLNAMMAESMFKPAMADLPRPPRGYSGLSVHPHTTPYLQVLWRPVR
jgi:hypothetical protein